MTDSGLDLAAPGTHRSVARPRRGIGCLVALLAFALVAAGLYVVATKGVAYLHDRLNPPEDYSGNGHGSVRVRIEAGQTASEIAATLQRKDVVASVEAFITAATADPDSTAVQPGVYGMHKQMAADSALALLLSSDSRIENHFAIPEGLSTEEIVAAIARQTDISAASLTAAAQHPDRLGLPAYAHGQLDGYLFPASYTLDPHASATEALTMMVDRFQEAASDTHLIAGAAALGLSPHDVVTTASLVQAEARRPQDFGKVAQVIANRDAIGLPLQLDSTVHYLTGTSGDVFTTAHDRSIDSPYNTYRYAGLPPGAIGAPGEAALRAALHPTPGPWLYFVTVNPATGKTLFATTLEEHNANVAQLRRFCLRSDAC